MCPRFNSSPGGDLHLSPGRQVPWEGGKGWGGEAPGTRRASQALSFWFPTHWEWTYPFITGKSNVITMSGSRRGFSVCH